MSLAAAGAPPDELGRIYEWYAARTSRAIATSYAAASLAAGALLKYVADDEHMTSVAAPVLLCVVGGAVITGVFQHAELAQLPRELAEATRLLASFTGLMEAEARLGRPRPRDDSSIWFGVLTWLTVLLVPCGLAVYWATTTKCHDLDAAVAAVAWVVLVALLKRILAEFPKAIQVPPRANLAWEDPPSLLDLIGDYQLDQYVTNPVVAEWVDTCIDAEWSALDDPLPA